MKNYLRVQFLPAWNKLNKKQSNNLIGQIIYSEHFIP